MNSLESDIVRSMISVRFCIALAVMLLILFSNGYDSELYRLCVPVACTLPYSCGFIDEYKSGFTRLALVRTNYRAYIWGKFFACGIAGGIVETLAVWIYSISVGAEITSVQYWLIFLSGMLWADVAAALAIASGSKYVAYGGSFVLYYFLVILNERYFKNLYCLNPHEWYAPEHIWIFNDTGIILMLTGLLVIILLIYELTARRLLENA